MAPDGSFSRTTTTANLWLDRGSTMHGSGGDVPAGCVRFAVLSRSSSTTIEKGCGSFWLVLRGAAQVSCREGRFWLRPGTWMALGRDSAPTVIVDRNTLVVALVAPVKQASAFAFDTPLLPVIYQGKGRLQARDRFRALGLWRSAMRMAEVSPAFLHDVGFFLSHLQEDVHARLNASPGRTMQRRQQVLARMQRAALILEGNVHRNVRLEDLAQVTNFSRHHFTNAFDQIYGCVPREMTSRLRLASAADLLAMTTLSVAEVAVQCGYQHASSFARAFRDFHGTPASSFRRTNRAAQSRFMQSILSHAPMSDPE